MSWNPRRRRAEEAARAAEAARAEEAARVEQAARAEETARAEDAARAAQVAQDGAARAREHAAPEPRQPTSTAYEVGVALRGQLESVCDEAYPQWQEIVARNRERKLAAPSMVDHHGDPAIAEDVQADELVTELIRKHFRETRPIMFGEEVGSPAAYLTEPGRIFFEVDAIDGSKPFNDLGTAYGMVITAYQADARGRLRLRATAQIGPLGRMSCAPSEGLVFLKEASSSVVHAIQRENLRDGDVNAVAAVAARPSRRALLKALMSVGDLSIYTVGAGNPAIFPLMLSRLGWVYEPGLTKSWDLVFLAALETAGGVVLGLDGQRRWILDELESLQSLDVKQRYLPGYVAVCSPDLVDGVRAILPSIQLPASDS